MLLIILLVLLVLACGGGFVANAGPVGFSPLGLILIILLVLFLTGNLNF